MNPHYCLLPSYGCVEVRGADTASFLHGQLSRSVDALDETHAPLAGWHDPRGRVRALLRVMRRADRWWLVTQSDVISAIVKRLAMFVLRAAVKVVPADDVRVAAILDADDSWLEAHGLASATKATGVVTRGELAFVRLGPNLWHVVGARAEVERCMPDLSRAPENDAVLAEITLGLPAVSAALVEHFVAQMLNLDLLDAVSFDKGCYPGQEVVARVHHLGSVKRRMRRYACDTNVVLAPGTPVANVDGVEVGEVVRAARVDQGVELLAVVDHSAASQTLLVGGERLRELPLPYAVPAT